jgi:glucoamylase
MRVTPLGSAFGAPGAAPTWSPAAKDLVTTSLGSSRVWATIGRGILNEVYWPDTGRPQVRDLGFIIAGDGFWVEVQREARYRVSTPAPHVPLATVVHEGHRYRLTLEFLPDPLRDVVLVYYSLEGEGLRLYALLAPHLGLDGHSDTAWVQRGRLLASSGERAAALLADPGFTRASAGYVGASDGWQDFTRHGTMNHAFEQAGPGNVALIGELEAAEGVLALGLGSTPEGAQTLAASSLADGYSAARERFILDWQSWGRELELPELPPAVAHEASLSATVLKVHEDRSYPGALVASLSIPWGHSHNDAGGYHMVWTRDAVQAALGLLAAGEVEDAHHVLAYLAATQAPDGGWHQTFFPDGRPHWTGVQLDEVGFPILLAAKLREWGVAEDPSGAARTAHMVRAAAAHIAQHGPESPQDRWEENAGASPFTLGVEVAALVAAASWLAGPERAYALDLADSWNERIEEWTYASDSMLSRRLGVTGHYVRVAPSSREGGLGGCVELRNRFGEVVPAEALVGLEFAYLVRLGLRRADDKRIVDSLKVAEAVLRVDSCCGPAYYRYNGDGYGEDDKGRPYNGCGIGRPWPLLTGERGHLALLQGEDPLPYLQAMVAMTGAGGLLPEQVWDREAVPERGLYPGSPTGSAMPLVWAHAEFLKLAVARETGCPLEQLDSVWTRYGGEVPNAAAWYWRTECPFASLPEDRSLVIEDRLPFMLHLGVDGWQKAQDRHSSPLGLGMHGVRLDVEELAGRRQVNFARYYPGEERWEDGEHVVAVEGRACRPLRPRFQPDADEQRLIAIA